MKTFLLKLALFFAVMAVFLGVVFAAYVRRFPPEKSYYMASRDKHARLETLPSPRLIFIGGSSMAFGMDSALVGERLGYQAVNMGLNHAVGLEFMLQEVEPFVRRGDVVLLAPEYSTIEQYYHSDPEYVARLIECRPSLLRVLNGRQTRELLDRGYVQHVGRVIRFICLGQVTLSTITNAHIQRGAFNEYGDVVSHHDAPGRPLVPALFKFKAGPSTDEAINHLNRFHDECRRRGARVFYSHPPYEQRSFERSRGAILKLDALLRQKMQIPMLDTVDDMVFPTADFFDTEYHLNLPAKRKRSERLAESLRKALEKPGAPL